jgi:hypothetical protein
MCGGLTELLDFLGRIGRNISMVLQPNLGIFQGDSELIELRGCIR